MQDLLDTTVVEGLIHGIGRGDPALLRTVVDMFTKSGPEKSREIRESFERGDSQGFAQAVHFLKGSAGTLGALRVRTDCERIEGIDPMDRAAELPELLDTLDQHLTESLQALEDLLSQQE